MCAQLSVTLKLHLYIHCRRSRRKLLAEAVLREQVKILTNFAFLGHGYAKQPGSELGGEYCIPPYSYLVPRSHDLLEALSLIMKTALFWRQKTTVFLQKILDQQGKDLDADEMKKNGSGKESNSKRSKPERSAFRLELGNVPEND